jgi:hypothetical protein
MKYITVLSIFIATILLIPATLQGQAVYAWCDIDLDEDTNTIYATASHYVDYDVSYHYLPSMVLNLYANGQLIGNAAWDPATNMASLYMEAEFNIDYSAVAETDGMPYFYIDPMNSAWFYWNLYYPGITEAAFWDPYNFASIGMMCEGYETITCNGSGPGTLVMSPWLPRWPWGRANSRYVGKYMTFYTSPYVYYGGCMYSELACLPGTIPTCTWGFQTPQLLPPCPEFIVHVFTVYKTPFWGITICNPFSPPIPFFAPGNCS